MAANNRSFAARIASISSNCSRMESWDDGDFDDRSDGLLFKNSTVHSLSSRMSVRSESESQDDWQFLISPDDQATNASAITSAAKQAGIPIPANVPSSALLGGSIKRLGKKKSTKKMQVDDDWGNDLELPANPSEALKLKPQAARPPADDADDDLDWGEGSLGIRFAGTRHATRGARSSSVSAMSPSLGSCMTMESEEDDLAGLVLPTEPMDFSARLEKLKKADHLHQHDATQPAPQLSLLPPLQLGSTSAPAPPPSFPTQEPPLSPTTGPAFFSPLGSPKAPSPKSRPAAEPEEDFEESFEFGTGEILDSKKLTLNKNIVVKKATNKANAPHAARPAITLTFTDRPTVSRIPRPLPSIASRTRLTPVYETGASASSQSSRAMPTTTSAQLLRAKRSAPVLRNINSTQPPRMPFIPAGGPTSQSHHVMAKSTSQTHLRRDSDSRRPLSPSLRSDSRRPLSPSMRSYSRSSAHQNETPSRAGVRRDLAPSAFARNPPPRKLTQPQRKRNFGDGHELDMFDDLPTSATKEKQFEKVPRNVGSNRSLRTQSSNSRLPMPDRMVTPQPQPQPQTPQSPPKMDNTPRFARDTAASRNAREQRLAGTRSRADGSVAQRPVSWAAQVASRSPHSSPNHKKKGLGQKPQLIRQMTQPQSYNEKGMTYNPSLQRWEGNEEELVSFSHPNTSTTTLALTTASTPTFVPASNHTARPQDRSQSISHIALSSIHASQAHRSFSARAAKLAQPLAPAPAPSPPRPALISQISVPRSVQYEGRMVFDPVKMTWLKAPRPMNDVRSSSEVDEDEDPFAGLEDLKDNESVAGGNGMSGTGTPNPEDPAFVGEEFDVGPSFIRRQRDEEAIWRRRVEGWVGGLRDNGEHPGGWRWAIRDFAASAPAGNPAF